MLSIFEYGRLLFVLLLLGLGGCKGLGGGGGEALKTASAGDVVAAAGDAVSGLLISSKPDYRLPGKVTLCGETFDLSRRPVYERLEFEFIRVVNHPAQVALWQRRAAVYFPYIEAELNAAGLPDDLKYLAVAESDLRPSVSSPAGALGLWQFMPATARHFKLKVDKKIDQRQLPEPLMGAAVAYFRSLNKKFGSWSLAMAAYNAGDGRVAKAVAAQGHNNYFDLDLPRETERYVYRIAAIKVVMENAAGYGFTEPVPARYRPVGYAERTVELPAKGQGQWTDVAKKLGYDYKTVRVMNPHVRQYPLAGSYELRVPAEKR
ncbi:lytic transglycosylase domain-containing protein [Deltaproteobacteria bacterium OttesenSCG-928-K17]|nr:lytic transglycosylase domain-containing protein [Deltaproteobacteria bacterium OttesenSCG-928-K17]